MDHRVGFFGWFIRAFAAGFGALMGILVGIAVAIGIVGGIMFAVTQGGSISARAAAPGGPQIPDTLLAPPDIEVLLEPDLIPPAATPLAADAESRNARLAAPPNLDAHALLPAADAPVHADSEHGESLVEPPRFEETASGRATEDPIDRSLPESGPSDETPDASPDAG